MAKCGCDGQRVGFSREPVPSRRRARLSHRQATPLAPNGFGPCSFGRSALGDDWPWLVTLKQRCAQRGGGKRSWHLQSVGTGCTQM